VSAATPAPAGATSSRVEHRVGFYETDAMGVVHHSNYLRFFERARGEWLREHDRPYTHYMDLGLHFAVTHAELDYRVGARFDDLLVVTTWAEWVRGASLRMAYSIARDEELLVTGATEHASVSGENGRVRRIPKPDRSRLMRLALPG
jgi:acyl-CoA thioester hydrolase